MGQTPTMQPLKYSYGNLIITHKRHLSSVIIWSTVQDMCGWTRASNLNEKGNENQGRQPQQVHLFLTVIHWWSEHRSFNLVWSSTNNTVEVVQITD